MSERSSEVKAKSVSKCDTTENQLAANRSRYRRLFANGFHRWKLCATKYKTAISTPGSAPCPTPSGNPVSHPVRGRSSEVIKGEARRSLPGANALSIGIAAGAA